MSIQPNPSQAFFDELCGRSLDDGPILSRMADPVNDPPKLARQIQDACVLARAFSEEAGNPQGLDPYLLSAGFRSLVESQRIFENELTLLASLGLDLNPLWQQLGELESGLYRLRGQLKTSDIGQAA